MKTIQKQIENIENQVRDFALLLKNTIGNNDEITNLLLGWKIFYSPIIINPKILFIGINPGGGDPGEPFGYYNEEHTIIEYLDVRTHSAKADFCCYILLKQNPTPKEMCSNDLLNQIA